MNNKQFKALLDRYSKGKCTREEKATLENWITFGDFKGRVLMGKQLDQRLADLAKRLPLVSMHRQLWQYIALAASILLTLGVGLWLYPLKESAPNFITRTSIRGDISPGGNAATLTLENGKEIVLDAHRTGVIIGTTGLSYDDGSSIKIPELKVKTVETATSLLQTISTPRGGTYQITLPDGTKVWLNASSSLTYPTDLKDSKLRKVKLTGEGYFEVAKNKNSPFIVESKRQILEVLGTHFNISSYEDDNITKTTLLEGSVRIRRPGKKEEYGRSGSVTIKPGQQALVKEADFKILSVNVENAIDWKNGDFIFDGEDFKTSMRKIARWYNVDVVYGPGLAENIELGGWVSRKSKLSTILKRLEKVGNLNCKIEGRKLIIEK